MSKALYLILFIALFGIVSSLDGSVDELKDWKDWKVRFSKNFDSQEDEEKAFTHWLDNLRKTSRLNTKADPNVKEPAQFTVDNEFGADDTEEFLKKYTGLQGRPKSLRSSPTTASSIGYSAGIVSVDWRTSGKLPPIRQQGGCGSCWTYSSTGAL